MVANIQKGLVFLISTHVALLGFVLIATLYGFSQPLLPIHILWLEFFIDSRHRSFTRACRARADAPPAAPRSEPLLGLPAGGRCRRWTLLRWPSWPRTAATSSMPLGGPPSS
jgi:hypothetical protein